MVTRPTPCWTVGAVAPPASQGHSPLRAELRRATLLAVPTAFDLVATVLMNVGLLSVTVSSVWRESCVCVCAFFSPRCADPPSFLLPPQASVYQMMRGAEMLFAALFSVTFLGRTLNKLHYAGIGCCVAGIAAVGAASVLSGEGSRTAHCAPCRNAGGHGPHHRFPSCASGPADV